MQEQNSVARCSNVVCSCPLGVQALGFPWVVQAKVSSHLCFAQGHPAWIRKQSEMAATYAGLGDFHVKPSCESRLAAGTAGSGAH